MDDWVELGFVLQRVTNARMVTTLQDKVTSKENIPNAAKVVAKNVFPVTSLSPVLMKHQVPGHCKVYFPTPAMGNKAKIKIRHQMMTRTCLVTLVFM